MGNKQTSIVLGANFGNTPSWETKRTYHIDEEVVEGSAIYTALEDHLSGVFATDLAATKWLKIGDGSIGVTGLAAAIAEDAITFVGDMLLRSDGTGTIQDSGITVDDSDNMSDVGIITAQRHQASITGTELLTAFGRLDTTGIFFGTNSMHFGTNSNERMSISSAGNLLLGATGAVLSVRMQVHAESDASTAFSARFRNFSGLSILVARADERVGINAADLTNVSGLGVRQSVSTLPTLMLEADGTLAGDSNALFYTDSFGNANFAMGRETMAASKFFKIKAMADAEYDFAAEGVDAITINGADGTVGLLTPAANLTGVTVQISDGVSIPSPTFAIVAGGAGIGKIALRSTVDILELTIDAGRDITYRNMVNNKSHDFFVNDGGADTRVMTIYGANANVGIGTQFPNASSILDLVSTTGALLLPRMNTTQRDALTEIEGMVIANITTNQIEYYNGTSWVIAA